MRLRTSSLCSIISLVATVGVYVPPAQTVLAAPPVTDSSLLIEKAAYLEQNLVDKHSLDGLYVSIVPVTPSGTKPQHTVDEPGNVIHAGVWTGRYLAGVAYQYAVTRDPKAREHGGEILRALRRLQEVTGKPGLLARGYMMGHGPVADWERDGRDSIKWHQGQGDYADYRWYGDVSVDNFNAILYGYAIYFDLAADAAQKQFIAHDVDRLMTHLLDNHCCIVDVDGEVTRWGHVGLDPDPARDDYYREHNAWVWRRYAAAGPAQAPLQASLMLLPDLLIADHITGNSRYMEFYRRVVDRYQKNPQRRRRTVEMTPERLARMDHSPEGQAYEALYNLIRYEKDAELLTLYRGWVGELWKRNWMEGNSLFAYMTFALLPEYVPVTKPGTPRAPGEEVPHAAEGLLRANRTLDLFPVDRVLRPVMNSLRSDIKLVPRPNGRGQALSTTPLPVNERPHDNEYEWKGNPYRLDGWLKPTVTTFAFSCDDPLVAWFTDSTGGIYMTLDGGKNWQPVNRALQGAQVTQIAASTQRTFVLWAKTDKGVFITRDGGLSWREAAADSVPEFTAKNFHQWIDFDDQFQFRVNDKSQLVRKAKTGDAEQVAMKDWTIPLAHSIFHTPWGIIASGPGGCCLTTDGERWEELKLWREDETGAADFLHAYWMGRYYGFLPK